MKLAKMFTLAKEAKSFLETRVEVVKTAFVCGKEIGYQVSTNWIGALVIKEDGYYEGIPYVVNDALALKLIKMPSILPAVALVRGDDGKYAIVMNKLMNQQPEWVIDAMMMHEVGHFYSGHLENSSRMPTDQYIKERAKLNKELIAEEIEADSYSLLKGKKIRSALIHLRNNYRALNTKEFDVRISHLLQAQEG